MFIKWRLWYYAFMGFLIQAVIAGCIFFVPLIVDSMFTGVSLGSFNHRLESQHPGNSGCSYRTLMQHKVVVLNTDSAGGAAKLVKKASVCRSIQRQIPNHKDQDFVAAGELLCGVAEVQTTPQLLRYLVMSAKPLLYHTPKALWQIPGFFALEM